MKHLKFVSALVVVTAVLCSIFPIASSAQEVQENTGLKDEVVFNSEDDIKLDGDYYSMRLFGNSQSGEWKEMVCDSLPFKLPEEGVVLLFRCDKLGSPLEPKDLSAVAESFRLYNIEKGTYLLPVGIITVEEGNTDLSKPGSAVDVLFYDEQYAGDSGYALACEDVIYSFDRMGRFSPYRYPLRTRTVDISELPEMPEPGSITGDSRPEYASILEGLLEKSDNNELKSSGTDYKKGGKAVAAVFNSYGTLTECSLDDESEEGMLDQLPGEFLASQLDEADYVILVHCRRERAGQYGINGGAAWRVYTLITVIDPETMEEYETITVSVNDPPESIRTDGIYSGGAEGEYEPEKAVEYILDMLKSGD